MELPRRIRDHDLCLFRRKAGRAIRIPKSAIPNAADHLGTPRVITDSEGKVISRRDFLPFGEEITPDIGARASVAAYQPTTDNVKQKFTGYQKDDETGLDFAEARMYENRHGRFTAVDPLLASGKSANPQTFNRYVYVGNNPLNEVDPMGLDWGRDPKTGRVQWFDGPVGEGFEPYNLLYAYRLDSHGNLTKQLVALNMFSGADVNVSSAAEWLETQVRWAKAAQKIGQALDKLKYLLAASSEALIGVPIAVAAVVVADLIDPDGRWRTGFNRPEPVHEFAATKPEYWDEFMTALSKKSGESASTMFGNQGETTPASPDPNDDGPKIPPLRFAHRLKESTLNFIRKWSTERIVDSLKPGSNSPLTVKPDGTIMQGNHRIQVLRERGLNVDNLPREIYVPSTYQDPWSQEKYATRRHKRTQRKTAAIGGN